MTTPRQQTARTAVLAALLAVSAAFAVDGTGQPTTDPRVGLIDLQRQERWEKALEATRALASAEPALAARYGLHLLEGHLLHHLGDHQAAMQAFVHAMEQSPDLALYSRYHLALEHAEQNHPEVAAGVVAKVVTERPPRPLLDDALELLLATLEEGGDCRLLRNVDPTRYDTGSRRRLTLAQADCALRGGDRARSRSLYLRLLRESQSDEPARVAADRLAPLAAVENDDEIARLLGLTYHQHRDFDRAISYLSPLVSRLQGPLSGDDWNLAYTLVRSRFWQERYGTAANGFGALAARSREPRLVARALYQQARCIELTGNAGRAAATYRRAYRADPTGNNADDALIGALRLEWRSGDEERALELFEVLVAQRRFISVAARAALYLASSDLVQGRADRAGRWLDVAARAGRETDLEVAYWRGRMAELQGAAGDAVRRYLQVLRGDAYHPLGLDALSRLADPSLEPAALGLAGRRRAAGGIDGLYDAWLLHAGDAEGRARLALDLSRALRADPEVAPFLTPSLVPTADWPLWREGHGSPEEKLLALGVWRGGQSAMEDHFPYSDPSLALTRSWLLARAGALRDSLRVAEVLARQVPDRLPDPFLPIGLRRLLHPFAYPGLIVRESLARGVDPHLLAAVVREESRFETRALSAASARGLTQFVQPTAHRMSEAIGLAPLTPDDLYRPEISLALGAAYLEQLVDEFDGLEHAAVAAYNAGEPAARLWRRHCYGDGVPELYTKISYRQTRAYVAKVLASRARYTEIYASPALRARRLVTRR